METFPIFLCMVPFNWLSPRSSSNNNGNIERSGGDPVIWFPYNWRETRLGSCPKVCGMKPLNWLKPTDNSLKEENHVKSRNGPLSRLSSTYKTCNESSPLDNFWKNLWSSSVKLFLDRCKDRKWLKCAKDFGRPPSRWL